MRRFTAVLLAICLVASGMPLAAAGAIDSTDTAVTDTAVDAPTPASADERLPAAVADSTGNADTDEANESASTTVTILSYNDIQTAMAENGTAPRMVHLINERRAAHDNPTVVIGGGDEVSPHSLSPLSQWELPIEVLNVIDPDVEGIGNHDLDYGFEAVQNFSAASEFPWVMANVVQKESGEPIPGTEPYHVVEKGGVKVGVIGLADEKIKSKTAVDFDEEGYELQDYTDVGNEYAQQLKEEENVDVVVVAGHFGVPVAQDLAENSERIDAIVVGDDEVEYPPQETSGTVIMEAEARAEHVAELNLTVENGEVTAWNGRLLNVTENTTYNQTAADIITETRGSELDRVVGVTETPLDSRFSSNYHDETALGNMITDAFRWKADSEIAITNAGGIRSNTQYEAGNVTVGEIYNVLPFRNSLVTVELTGSEVKSLLASQIVTLESETGSQYGAEPSLQVSGIAYEYVPHESVPAEQRIQDAWVGDQPLNDSQTYTVTVNSYMAGWDGSVLENATRVSETQSLYGTVTLEYVQAMSPVSPTDADRIRRVDYLAGTATATLDSEGETTLTFKQPPNATEFDAGSFYATTDTSTRVNATAVETMEDEVAVTFDDSALQTLADGPGAVQIYGLYDDSGYNHSYFEKSIFGGDLQAAIENPTTTTSTTTQPPTTQPPTTADTTTGESTDSTAAPGDSTTTEGVSDGTPGFGPAASLVALASVALLAFRRQ
ncbi:5'-nucleotidase C-terminal domain-containing protein [Haloarchaeobius sp. DFWS5]|uniref:5'-nucleotidase C-terminal domain-containing protein n=1 Tax=Haloarchaeobius sp. DFWS5 TaxID=3446114 RepID=UPI003EBC44BE